MKVLIVSHDASRTGAPILLLNLANALKAAGVATEFLLKHGGSLENDFRALGKTYLFYKAQGNSLLDKLRRKLFKPQHHSLAGLDWQAYDLVLSNTITNGDILPHVRRYYKGPLVSYIHELEMAAGFFTNRAHEQLLVQHTDLFLTPCLTVKNFIVERHALDPNKVQVLSYYIPAGATAMAAQERHKNFFYVGGVGTVDWRKSPDLFVQVAAIVFSRLPQADIRFLWKGAPEGGVDLDRVKYDVRKAGLTGKVEFIKASADTQSFYSSLDVFLLTSREDPYPLVVLEAADAAVPTICFKGAGGAVEFVESAQGGVCVNYLDTAAMAGAIIHYYQEEEERRSAGKQAKARLTATHQHVPYVVGQFESIVKTTRNHAL